MASRDAKSRAGQENFDSQTHEIRNWSQSKPSKITRMENTRYNQITAHIAEALQVNIDSSSI